MWWKRRLRRRLRLPIVLLVALIAFLTVRARPLIRELATARVENQAQNVINDAVERLLEQGDIQYDRIVLLEKDVEGNVTALKTNIAEVNRLKTKTLAAVDSMVLELSADEVGLPLGSLVFPTFFSGSGPKLPVRILSISNSDADFRNVFSEAGINQTAHQIMMEVQLYMTVLTPVGTENVCVSSSVVVAETVIVGRVPQSYVNVGE